MAKNIPATPPIAEKTSEDIERKPAPQRVGI